MRQIMCMMGIGLACGLAYRYRYRLLNMFFRQSFLRKLAIASLLRIPFIRKRLMGSLFTYPNATNAPEA
ncbi:sodium:proton antiporter [Bacillus sp. FSL W7-1360]